MATINTVGKVVLPFTFYGNIVGTYTDDTIRIIDVTIAKVGVKLPPFPNQPVTWGSLGTSTGPATVGIRSARRDPDNADQLIVTVDRGYAEEFAGEVQPVAYPIPETATPLCYASPAAQAMEAQAFCVANQAVLEGGAKGDGIIPALLDAFEVVAQNPEALGVAVSTGLAAVDGALIYQAVAENVALVPVFIEDDEDDYLMTARIYIDPLNGEIGVVYGAAHVDTPVAPSYPAGVIKLAQIDITQGDVTVATADITTERVLA